MDTMDTMDRMDGILIDDGRLREKLYIVYCILCIGCLGLDWVGKSCGERGGKVLPAGAGCGIDISLYVNNDKPLRVAAFRGRILSPSFF